MMPGGCCISILSSLYVIKPGLDHLIRGHRIFQTKTEEKLQQKENNREQERLLEQQCWDSNESSFNPEHRAEAAVFSFLLISSSSGF